MGKKAKAAGNPVPHPDGGSWTDRLSPSRVTGGAAPSTGDHNAAAFADPMNVAGPKRLALGHPDMQNGTTSPLPLFTSRTNADEFPADRRGMSTGVPVAMSRLDAAGATTGLSASGNPVTRPLDHIARNSAIAPNGTHGLSDPRSHAAPMAAKAMTASEARATLKRHMFPGSGGGR